MYKVEVFSTFWGPKGMKQHYSSHVCDYCTDSDILYAVLQFTPVIPSLSLQTRTPAAAQILHLMCLFEMINDRTWMSGEWGYKGRNSHLLGFLPKH